MLDKKPLPVAVTELINLVDNRNAPIQHRTNARDTLQNISDESFRTVKRFDREVGIKRPKIDKATTSKLAFARVGAGNH